MKAETDIAKMASIFKKVQGGIDAMLGDEKHSHAHIGHVCDDLHLEEHRANRYHSFAPESSGDVKWYVDGCSYFWAVSEALERKCFARAYPFNMPLSSHSLTPVAGRGKRRDFHLGLVVESRALPPPTTIPE
jgi:phospholipase D1/2